MKKKILLASLLSLVLFQSQAFAQITVVHPLGQTKNFFELEQGQNFNNIITLKNLGTEKSSIHIYAADGAKTDLGGFTIKPDNRNAKTIGAWLKLKETDFTFEPGESKDIEYTINVPDNVVPGQYSGGLAIERSTGEDPTIQGMGVKISTRVIEPIYVSIKGDVVTKYTWSDFFYDNTSGNNFNIGFINDGNSIISAQGKITITGTPFEPEVKEIPINPIILQQKDKSNVTYEWKESPFFGFYKAKAEMEVYKNDYATGEKIKLESITKEINFTFIPWPLIFAILAIIALAVGYKVYKTQMRKNDMQKAKKYTVTKGDTIKAVAEKNGIDWNELAKFNKIKPPYELKEGSTILIPKK